MRADLDEPHIAALRDLGLALRELELEPVIVGGIAASLIAQPCQTRDIDALVIFDTSRAAELLRSLQQHGFRPRFSGMEEFAVAARLITIEHEQTGLPVDIALGCMPFEAELIQRSEEYAAGDVRIRLPSPEDLVVLKAIANRPKDQEDIRRIADVYPNLDRERIKVWVDQYGELLESPDLWDQIEPLLAGSSSGS